MAMTLDLLGLQLDSPLAYPAAKNFRPPSWPPPADWAPVVDAEGNAICRYADSMWPLDVWSGYPLKVNFGDGTTRGARISSANADLLRRCAVWFLWGPRGCRAASTFADKVATIKPLFVACTQQGVLASDLVRFEAVVDEIAQLLSPSGFASAITVLHELLDAKEQLGFCLLDRDGLSRLAKLAPAHEERQTPFIPPRIWTYQMTRMRECLEDYTKYRAQIEACFGFCLEAYAHNYGSLGQALSSRHDSGAAPFQNRQVRTRCKYHGSFGQTAQRFGIADLIEKWIGPLSDERQLAKFSQYLDLASTAGLAYLLNFSLMRIEEAWKLRSDCLLIEKDESFGDIHVVCGETTKTDPDADARWPVSKSASLAIDVTTHIAALRVRCAKERNGSGVTDEDVSNPYLMSYQYEPWSRGKHKSYRTRPAVRNYQQCLDYYPRLLDAAEITITEDDLRIARLMTPSLDESVFIVGRPWQFTWHQLRRTGAVNMLSSDMVDEASLQLLLKHQSRVMTLYYGRNHSRLLLNEETRALFLTTMYQEIGRNLRNLESPRFVSPLGVRRKHDIVTFIKDTDAAGLDRAARRGQVGARRIRAGFCVNHRACPYGGIEAIAHCLGGDGGNGCPDLMLDVERRSDIRLYEIGVDEQLKVVHADSPRFRSLQTEKRAIERFYAIVEAQDG